MKQDAAIARALEEQVPSPASPPRRAAGLPSASGEGDIGDRRKQERVAHKTKKPGSAARDGAAKAGKVTPPAQTVTAAKLHMHARPRADQSAVPVLAAVILLLLGGVGRGCARQEEVPRAAGAPTEEAKSLIQQLREECKVRFSVKVTAHCPGAALPILSSVSGSSNCQC